MSIITGGCACGGVRYEVSEPFVSSNYCHCTRCQRRTGTAASANGRTAEGAFRLVQGEELVKCWDPGGGGFLKCFCSNCGSALYSCNPETKGDITVRLGTVDGDPGIRPEKHQFTDYAAIWEPNARRRLAALSGVVARTLSGRGSLSAFPRPDAASTGS